VSRHLGLRGSKSMAVRYHDRQAPPVACVFLRRFSP